MSIHVQFRFGVNVVDPLARTVFRSGEPQTPEPKVFDTILFLIAQRNRVVTKQELLDEVWGSQVVVTEGVVARTIMKARRLIGDDADDPAIIKTIHRIGYRFVANVDEEPVDRPEHGSTTTAWVYQGPSPQGVRVAILPFDNQTGRDDMAWIDFGLMSTTIDALALLPGVRVTPAEDLLAVVGAHDPALSLNVSGQKLADALGVSDTVQVVAKVDSNGNVSLDYAGFGPALGEFAGQMAGFDPIALCQHLAKEIQARIAPDSVVNGSSTDTSSNENAKDAQFVHVARTRALHAIHIERWELARKLLRVALDISPSDVTMRLDYARCLVWQRDSQAVPLLEEVLKQSRDAMDAALQVRALHLYATYLHGDGKLDQAERLLSEALKIAEAQQDQESELQLLVSMGEALTSEGRISVAAWMLDRASQLASALGNHVATARLMDVRGRIASIKGDEPTAMAAFSEAAGLSERYGIFLSAAFSVTHVGTCLLNAGRMIAAAECFDRAFRHACQSGSPVSIGVSGLYAVRYGGLRHGDVTHASGIIDQMRQSNGNDSLLGLGCADFAEAFVKARGGSLEESDQMLVKAEQRFVGSRSFAFHAARYRARTLVCLGRIEEADDICVAIQSRVAGRLKRPAQGAVLHCRGLIARAAGFDAEASRLFCESVSALPPSIAQMEASLDAAWLYLEADEVANAQKMLAGIKPFLAEALTSEYGAAMLVQARLHFVEADIANAIALQKRYCQIMSCVPESSAYRCLVAYERSSEHPQPLPPMRGLPSLFELNPGMELTKSRLLA